MKVSLNTIKQYTDVDLSVDKLVAKINQQLGGVEEVIDFGKRYEGAVIVKVVTCDDHPNADRLHVCTVDDGSVAKDVARDADGYVQVVCGAPNVHADMFAVWLPPTATVPSSFDDKEPFVLEARDLRGVVSNGMLASAKELGIGDSHEGILEIDPNEWKPSKIDIKPGVSFAEAYGLDDTIIDIENKMFTHRPDLFGQLGVAREIAGIQHAQFVSPDWYKNKPEFKDASGLQLEVFNEAHEKVPRFMAVALKDITIKPSPLWLQCELVRLGSKPINNIVDVTNYVMLLTAQPTHAYDYDKLRGHTLGARLAKKGEKLTLLNHKTYELSEHDIVIADGDGPVGLAGIMGGGDSEVDERTRSIVLEVASFDMYTLRKSSMRHGVFTDALTRFNKGQSPLQNDHVLSLLMQSIFDVSSGEQASNVFDKKSFDEQNQKETRGVKWAPKTIPVSFINDRLGLKLTDKDVVSLLENVEFHSHDMGNLDEVCITPPFWRTDIELAEDIVEEVGRLYGFDKLPRVLPTQPIASVPKNPMLVLRQAIRDSLSRAGANEVLTYSFVHSKLLADVGQDVKNSFALRNALSPDLQYYRQSLTPSLLDRLHPNIKAGYAKLALFELGKGHIVSLNGPDDLPKEIETVALVFADQNPSKDNGSSYYQARRFAETVLAELGVAYSIEPIDFELTYLVDQVQITPFDRERTAYVRIQDSVAGFIGELRPEVRTRLKLPAHTAAFELDLARLLRAQNSISTYQPLSKFPKVEQDITLQIPKTVTFASIHQSLVTSLDGICPDDVSIELQPLSIYRRDDSSLAHVSFRVEAVSHQRTLQSSFVNDLLDKVAESLHAQLGAQRV